MRYKGSVSAFWWILTAAVIAVCVLYLVRIVLSGGADALTCVLGVVPVGIAALLVWSATDNYVELQDTVMRVCVGPFRLKIPYGDIKQVSRKRSAGAAIALALGGGRVNVERRGGVLVVVSVEDPDGLIGELRRRAGCDGWL